MEKESKLLKEASKAMENAHVLWASKLAPSFSLRWQIYGGCNVESWVSALGICAERCAINHAVLHRNRKIKE